MLGTVSDFGAGFGGLYGYYTDMKDVMKHKVVLFLRRQVLPGSWQGLALVAVAIFSSALLAISFSGPNPKGMPLRMYTDYVEINLQMIYWALSGLLLAGVTLIGCLIYRREWAGKVAWMLPAATWVWIWMNGWHVLNNFLVDPRW